MLLSEAQRAADVTKLTSTALLASLRKSSLPGNWLLRRALQSGGAVVQLLTRADADYVGATQFERWAGLGRSHVYT